MIRIGAGELAIEAASATLRAACALSCATNRSFRWDGFRRKSSPPGFGPSQSHLPRLFASLVDAETEGGLPGETTLEFRPRSMRPGSIEAAELRIEVPPEDSMLPFLRAATLPLARSATSSQIVFAGSTHGSGGETFEVTSSTWTYLLGRLGIDLDLRLDLAGFAPRGGGELRAKLDVRGRASGGWMATDFVERDPLTSVQIVSAGARLPAHVQQRQAARARSGVHAFGVEPTVQLVKLRASGGGSIVAVTGQFGELPATFASVSERGKSAETVGEQAAAAFRNYAKQSAVIPGRFVDALVLFLALAEGASTVTTSRLPSAMKSLAHLVHAFTGREVGIDGKLGQPGRIRIGT